MCSGPARYTDATIIKILEEIAGTEVKADGEDHILLLSEDLLVKYVAADAIPE